MILNDKIPIISARLEYVHLSIKSNQEFVKKTYFLTLLSLLFLSAFSVKAQEFAAKVELNKERINRTGIDHINELPKQIEDYFNNFKWTDQKFLEQERLNCTIQINLNEVSESLTFSASIIIQLNRPIYGTTQSTPILVLVDNAWSFNYQPNRVFIHDEFQFDEIASLLDYYAYLMLAFDADTFAPLGGTPFFNKANNLYNLANTTSALGWTRTTRQGRAVLIEAMINPTYEGLRNAQYTYHRLGLDMFNEDVDEARKSITNALLSINDNRKVITELYPFDLFFNSKYREITAVFKDADPSMKLNIYTLLVEMDPSHISKYDELK
ncbi:DUF4835 family protein [bacterium]|nr:MAG: DUF4835 family protein [bacterium]